MSDTKVDSGKYKVFISYSHQDVVWRDSICEHLKNEGFDVEYDETGLCLGKPWRPELQELIDECDAMLTLLSDNSAESQWVLFEFVWALAKGKKPIFWTKEGVNVPDPIQDIQGQVGTYESVLSDVAKIIEALRQISQENRDAIRSASPLPPTDPVLLPGGENKYRRMNDDEVVRALLSAYLDQRDLFTPVITVLEQTVASLARGIEHRVYLEVINRLMDENAEILLRTDLHGPEYKLCHQRQWRLGECRSELLVNQPWKFFDWTNPIEGTTGSIIVSKYLLTRGVYYEFQRDIFNKDIVPGSEAGYPFNLQVDQFQPGSPQDHRLRDTTIAKLAEWLEEVLRNQGKRVRRVRLPTFEEWRKYAAPKHEWDRHTLRACNLISTHVGSTEVAAVDTYPMARSPLGCCDAMGNIWELCEQGQKLFIAGWSHKNTVDDIQWDWDSAIELEGRAREHPVGLRFVAEI